MATFLSLKNCIRFTTYVNLKRLVITACLCVMAHSLSAQQWQPMGPEGGQIRCGVSMGNTLLVGTGSGVYESTDGGATFKPKSVGMPSGNVIDLFADGSYVFACIENKGIYRSSDGGARWELKLPGRYLSQNVVGHLRMQKADGHLMLRNTDDLKDTLYFSADNGDTWLLQPVNVFLNASNQVFGFGDAFFTNSAAGVLGPVQGLYRTDDLGKNWVFSGTGIGSGLAINVMVSVNDTLYALHKHIYQSTDKGRNWKQLTRDTLKNPNSSFAFVPLFYAFSGRTVYARNGGNVNIVNSTWTPGQSGWQAPVAGSPVKGGGLSMFAHQGKVFQCVFNDEFNAVAGPDQPLTPAAVKGINATLVNDLHAAGGQVLATTDTRVLIANDWNSGWWTTNPAAIADDKPLRAITRVGNNLLLGATDVFNAPLRLYVSKDGGNSWQAGLQTVVLRQSRFLSLGDTTVLFGTDGTSPLASLLDAEGGLIKGLTGVTGFSGTTEWLAIRRLGDTLYGLVTRRNNPSSRIVKRHVHAGNNWQQVNQFLFPGGAFSFEIWKDRMYLGRALGDVWVSRDKGASWSDLSKGLGQAVVNHLEAAGDTLVAASNKGIFILKQGDTTWTNISGDLPVSDFTLVQSTANHLWVLAENGGVWRLPRRNILQVPALKQTTAAISVYPNPAGDWLSFECAQGEWFVYDLQGRLWAEGSTSGAAKPTTIPIQHLEAGQYVLQVKTREEMRRAVFIKQ